MTLALIVIAWLALLAAFVAGCLFGARLIGFAETQWEDGENQ